MPAGLSSSKTQERRALLPLLPIPGSKGKLLRDLEIPGAWAASKRIRAASRLVQWVLLTIP